MRSLDLPVHRGLRTLEPRLRSLLELGAARLFELHGVERRRLDAAVAEFDRALERLRSASDVQRAAVLAEIRAARASLFVPRSFGVYYPANLANAGYVSVLVWSDASSEDLTDAGIRIRSRAVDTFTADIPLRLLWSFVDPAGASSDLAAAFKYVELARPWRFQLIDAVPTAAVNTLHVQGVTGRGVIVGVIDSGIDVYHEHFLDAGNSRVEFIWDQTLQLQPNPHGTEQPPAPGADFTATYGVEYEKSWIDAELANGASGAPLHQIMRSMDTEGHGTSVASCAASSGHTVGGGKTYLGAAPGASIIAVKLDAPARIFADSTRVLDAAAYIYARAKDLGSLPCVINLSMSDNLGAHDGTTLGEQLFDKQLLTPGRLLVCSAGNQNQAQAHVRGVVASAGSTLELIYTAFGGMSPRFNDSVQIWYDGHDRLTLQIDIPSVPAITVGPVLPGSNISATIPGTSIGIEVRSDLSDPRNGDNVIDVVISNPAAEVLPLGTWQWTLAPAGGHPLISGAFAAWADRDERDFLRSWTGAIADIGSIGVPATGFRTIAVGGHMKNDPTTILIESGCGPSRDGRVRPEICATGQVLAAQSKDAPTWSQGGVLRPFQGTSAAAPLVAGAAACLFECRGGSLASSDIKQILLDEAAPKPVSASDNTFGFGTLDVSSACIRTLATVDVWLRDSNLDTGVEPYAGTIPPFSSPDIEVLDAAGNSVPNPEYHPTNLWNNIIAVTVRNRGTGMARNVDVYLYWTDPATYIPFPAAWYSSGIYTGEPAFITESNHVAIAAIPSGGSHTVHFAWAPPAPGTGISSDAHFCLLARVEHEADQSNLGSGGWGVVAGSNNIAMRNVIVLDASTPAPPTGLRIVGSGDDDTLECWTEGLLGEVELLLPTAVLPWRELRTIAARIQTHGDIELIDQRNRDLDEQAASRILGMSGASLAQVRGPLTRVRTGGDSIRIELPVLRLRENAAALVRVAVNKVRVHRDNGFLHIAQRSGGKVVGGVQIKFRRELPRAPRYIVIQEGGNVIVRHAEGYDGQHRSTVRRRIPARWRQVRRRTTI